MREYERGLEMALADHHPWRRRGLYRVALNDIADARRQETPAFAGDERTEVIERRLQAELDQTPGVAADTPSNVTA